MRDTAVWLPIVAVGLAFVVFCYVELIRHPAKNLPKAAWAVIILVQIPLGGIGYLLFGRGEHPTSTASAGAAGIPPAGADATPRRTATMATEATGTAAQRGPASAADDGSAVAPGDVAVRTRALTKVFHDGVGLHAVDLTVPARGVYGLVGPNGAGKTTLLSLLAGLRRPDSGQIRTTARVMLCPDTPVFEPWLTAAETVDLFRDLGPRSTTDTDHALALAGLADARDRRVGGFSRGMTQRLGLAVMLASGAEVLLLDEPTSALDPQGRSEILDLIAALGRDHAVVLSSHILADVQRIADTVGILREGRLLYQGPVDELLDRHTRPSWRLHLRSGADRLADRLSRLDWVATVERHERGLRVDTTNLHAGETLLPAQITASGAELIAFNPVGADLETVFLSMVEVAS